MAVRRVCTAVTRYMAVKRVSMAVRRMSMGVSRLYMAVSRMYVIVNTLCVFIYIFIYIPHQFYSSRWSVDHCWSLRGSTQYTYALSLTHAGG